MQVITAIYLLMLEGQQNFDAMLPSVKHATYQAVKREFKKVASRMPAAQVYLQMLPVEPLELQTQQPLLWASAFPVGGPAPCKFQLHTMQRCIAGIPMRITRSDIAVPGTSCVQVAHASGAEMGQGFLQHMATRVLQQLQNVQQVQQQMFDAMRGIQSGASAVASPPRLQLLQAPSHEATFLRRAQSMLPAPVLALGNGAESSTAGLPSETPSASAAGLPPATPEEVPKPATEALPKEGKKTVEAAAQAMIDVMQRKQQAAKECKRSIVGEEGCEPAYEVQAREQGSAPRHQE